MGWVSGLSVSLSILVGGTMLLGQFSILNYLLERLERLRGPPLHMNKTQDDSEEG